MHGVSGWSVLVKSIYDGGPLVALSGFLCCAVDPSYTTRVFVLRLSPLSTMLGDSRYNEWWPVIPSQKFVRFAVSLECFATPIELYCPTEPI